MREGETGMTGNLVGARAEREAHDAGAPAPTGAGAAGRAVSAASMQGVSDSAAATPPRAPWPW